MGGILDLCPFNKNVHAYSGSINMTSQIYETFPTGIVNLQIHIIVCPAEGSKCACVYCGETDNVNVLLVPGRRA